MVALKGSRIDGFLKRPDPEIRAVLIYGPDNGLVSERGAAICRHVVDDLDDPFNVTRLDDHDITQDPARLADEMQSQSLMGGRRVVRVSSAGAGFAKAIESLLDDDDGDTLVVAEAGDLKPSAKLRKIFEASRRGAALPCYPDNARAIDDLISTVLNGHGLDISMPARALLSEALGSDRRLSLSELEKLALYCLGMERVEVEHVESVCTDAASATMDEMVDAVARGNTDALDLLYRNALASGVSSSGLLIALSRHLFRLQSILSVASETGNVEAAMKSARPPVHFMRQDSMRLQLNVWNHVLIKQAIQKTAQCEFDSRTNPALADTLVWRLLMSICRQVYSLRRRSN